MKIIFISMPDVTPVIIHEAAVHMPAHGIACVAGNIDPDHEVFLVDLVRKRRNVRKYLTRTLSKIRPDIVGLSAMAWQFDTCTKIARLIKTLFPETKIVIGGYHATLMAEEIADAPESRDIDFMVRGEGEECCRRLVNALAGRDRIEEIPALSYRKGGRWVHTPWQGPLDLSPLKLPVRDKRRLTWGYHILYYKVEVLETSRGCTRGCNYCSMRHMYGRTFRTYPIERVLRDLDDIYFKRKARWAFVVDDNMVLDPQRVIALCDAIIARGYRKLNLVVQADCITMSTQEEMVKKMAQAGFKSVFLGVENATKKNLAAAHKGDIVSASQKAVEMCHKYGIMVIAGMIFGFPDDREEEIVRNYAFLKQINADGSYCQILTPYPKTGMREDLLEKGLVVNKSDYRRYSGLWANVRTRHLDADQLQFLFWYHRQVTLGWWNPSRHAKGLGKLWTGIWTWLFRPLLEQRYKRMIQKVGWEGRYIRERDRLERMNSFPDLEQ